MPLPGRVVHVKACIVGRPVPLKSPEPTAEIALPGGYQHPLYMHDAPLLNSAQVSEWLGISPRTVCLWAELNELPGFKLGHHWRFRENDIRSWLQSNLARPESRKT
jgi:excisionase family DNA binding protein